MLNFSLGTLMFFVSILMLFVFRIRIRFLRWVAVPLLFVSIFVSTGVYAYLDSYTKWESEPYPDTRKTVEKERIREPIYSDSDSSLYVMEHENGYLIMRFGEPCFFSKDRTMIRLDESISEPYWYSYQPCRKYYCPNPGLLRILLLQFDEPCDSLIREDPDARLLYEIVLPDSTMASALLIGTQN